MSAQKRCLRTSVERKYSLNLITKTMQDEKSQTAFKSRGIEASDRAVIEFARFRLERQDVGRQGHDRFRQAASAPAAVPGSLPCPIKLRQLSASELRVHGSGGEAHDWHQPLWHVTSTCR